MSVLRIVSNRFFNQFEAVFIKKHNAKHRKVNFIFASTISLTIIDGAIKWQSVKKLWKLLIEKLVNYANQTRPVRLRVDSVGKLNATKDRTKTH